MKARSLGIVTLLVAMVANLAFAGGEAPNGTDNPPNDSGSAWFLDSSRTIRYCLASAPGFGVSAETLSQDIHAAFATWAAYIDATGVDDGWPDSSFQFATKIQEIPVCDGTQDLKFDFGVADSDVIGQKLLYANPTAFAYRKSFDPVASWSQGVIWLSPPGQVSPDLGFPNWGQDQILMAVLLHELGHVYGVGHVDKTIMSASLSFQLMTGQLPVAFQTSIDWKRDLLFCEKCSSAPNPGVLGFGAGVDEDVKVFQFLTGRAPVGTISAALVPARSASSPHRSFLRSGVALVVSDGQSSFTFPLTIALQTDDPEFDLDAAIFKRFKQGTTWIQHNAGSVSFGSIELSPSRNLDIILELNSSNEDSIGPITIKYLKGGLPHTIFRALPVPFSLNAVFQNQ